MRELQPNSRHCFVCGLENTFGLKLKFYKTGPDEVTAEYTVPERYQGYPGVVHGGVVAALLDEVVGRALMGTDPKNPRFLFTARLTVRYRKNVPTGQPLRIVGRIVREKPSAAAASGVIYNPAGDVLAEADGLLVNVPEEVLRTVDPEALGWKVYPEEGQPA